MNFTTNDIAPCGINCAVCYAHLRIKNQCPGCRGEAGHPKHCSNCRIRNCGLLNQAGRSDCLACKDFPCKPFKSIDTNYRRRYGISTIDNLKSLFGNAKEFLRSEQIRWTCNCGGTVCANTGECTECSEGKK